MFLHGIKFEPRNEQRAIDIKPGTSIDEKSADSAASALRKQLMSEGYRDAQVETSLKSVGFRKVDMRVHVNRGPRYTVDSVEFTGDPKLDLKKLKKPWRRLPYSDPAVESALSETRSLYLSNGYFDAEVSMDHVKQNGAKVTMVVDAKAGKQYRMQGGAAFSARDLCACVFQMQRASEKDGTMDFRARFDIDGSPDEDFVTVRPVAEQGPPFTVGRIEFRGNHAYGDITLRRALKLDEGAIFDGDRFRASVSRLNDLKLFQPLAEQDIEIRRDDDAHRADLIFHMKERPRGKWSFSGPVIPVGLVGPFSGSITSRLPGWGRGILEASTYYFSFSMLGFPGTFSRFLPFGNSTARWLPLLTIARPALPGQRWFSGFSISPQYGLNATLLSYGMSQAHQGLRALLKTDSIDVPSLAVPMQWISPARPAKAGALFCHPPQTTLTRLRRLAATANEMVLGTSLF